MLCDDILGFIAKASLVALFIILGLLWIYIWVSLIKEMRR